MASLREKVEAELEQMERALGGYHTSTLGMASGILHGSNGRLNDSSPLLATHFYSRLTCGLSATAAPAGNVTPECTSRWGAERFLPATPAKPVGSRTLP